MFGKFNYKWGLAIAAVVILVVAISSNAAPPILNLKTSQELKQSVIESGLILNRVQKIVGQSGATVVLRGEDGAEIKRIESIQIRKNDSIYFQHQYE